MEEQQKAHIRELLKNARESVSDSSSAQVGDNDRSSGSVPVGENIISGADELPDCVKCSEKVDKGKEGSLGKKSKQVIHSGCASIYKMVCRKTSKDNKYKSWWNSLTNEEQTEYFRKRRHANEKGSIKRALYDLEEVIETAEGEGEKDD